MRDEHDFSDGKPESALNQTRMEISLDPDLMEALKKRTDESGRFFHEEIDRALRAHLLPVEPLLTPELVIDVVRTVVREELRALRHGARARGMHRAPDPGLR